MRYGSVKHIALYYKAIPGMLRLLRQELSLIHISEPTRP